MESQDFEHWPTIKALEVVDSVGWVRKKNAMSQNSTQETKAYGLAYGLCQICVDPASEEVCASPAQKLPLLLPGGRNIRSIPHPSEGLPDSIRTELPGFRFSHPWPMAQETTDKPINETKKRWSGGFQVTTSQILLELKNMAQGLQTTHTCRVPKGFN